ncbi:MAG: PIN domain-containing protein [Ilumatobacteraceae bacterium]
MIAADTSVLVPALLASHEFHEACHESAGLIDAAVGHALFETYAVLTRLPQPYTVAPVQASRALRTYSSHVLVLPGDEVADAIDRFVVARANGGATYDALIAVTAMHHGASLLTRDERAVEVYERLGADIMWVAT